MSNRDLIEKMRAEDTRQLYTRKQAAALFNRSVAWFAKVAKDRKLRSIPNGRYPMFPKDVLYDLMIKMDE
jgi:hypothetical protein